MQNTTTSPTVTTFPTKPFDRDSNWQSTQTLLVKNLEKLIYFSRKKKIEILRAVREGQIFRTANRNVEMAKMWVSDVRICNVCLCVCVGGGGIFDLDASSLFLGHSVHLRFLEQIRRPSEPYSTVMILFQRLFYGGVLQCSTSFFILLNEKKITKREKINTEANRKMKICSYPEKS